MNEPAENETEFLLRFLQGRDHACPKCSYNLRNLTRPICPECGEALALTVGRRKTNDALFILTLAPCIFSGISAIFLSCAIAFQAYRLGGSPPIEVWAMDSFGVFSGLCGLILFVKRRAFTRLDRGVQFFWAFLAWAIHIAVFFAVLANV
ncbi:MAG: hypothetical protein IH895_09295, partial [Planctomycetes bacterium]|nr:hypothetical protein [Planctomycetota bacterium]